MSHSTHNERQRRKGKLAIKKSLSSCNHDRALAAVLKKKMINKSDSFLFDEHDKVYSNDYTESSVLEVTDSLNTSLVSDVNLQTLNTATVCSDEYIEHEYGLRRSKRKRLYTAAISGLIKTLVYIVLVLEKDFSQRSHLSLVISLQNLKGNSLAKVKA